MFPVGGDGAFTTLVTAAIADNAEVVGTVPVNGWISTSNTTLTGTTPACSFPKSTYPNQASYLNSCGNGMDGTTELFGTSSTPALTQHQHAAAAASCRQRDGGAGGRHLLRRPVGRLHRRQVRSGQSRQRPRQRRGALGSRQRARVLVGRAPRRPSCTHDLRRDHQRRHRLRARDQAQRPDCPRQRPCDLRLLRLLLLADRHPGRLHHGALLQALGQARRPDGARRRSDDRVLPPAVRGRPEDLRPAPARLCRHPRLLLRRAPPEPPLVSPPQATPPRRSDA